MIWTAVRAWEHPVVILTSVALVLLLSVVGALRLRLDTDQLALLPGGHPASRAMERYREESGVGAHIVLVRSNDPATTREFVNELAAALARHSDMGLVATGDPVEFFEARALYYLDVQELGELEEGLADLVEYNRSLRNPFVEWIGEVPRIRLPESRLELRDRYQTPDGTGGVVLVRPRRSPGDLEFARRLNGEVAEIAAQLMAAEVYPGVVVTQHGSYAENLRYYLQFRDDMLVAPAVGLLLLVVLLWIAVRSAVAVLLTLAPLAIGITVALGGAGFVLGRLNLLSAFAATILLGVGIDYALHWMVELRHWADLPASQAVVRVTAVRGRPLTVSAMTTAAAFLTLLIARNRAYFEFGLIAGVGVLACWLATLVVLPALVRLCRPRVSVLRPPTRARLLAPRRVLVPAVLAAALGAGLVILDPGLFQYTLSAFRSEELDPDVRSGKVVLREVFVHRFSPLVFIGPAGSLPGHDELTGALVDLHPEGEDYEIVSSLELVPAGQELKNARFPLLEARLLQLLALDPDEETRAQVERGLRMVRQPPFRIQDVPAWLRGMVDLDGVDQAVLVFTSRSISDGRVSIPMRRALAPLAGEGAVLTGEAVIFAALLEMMLTDGMLCLGLALVVVVSVIKFFYPGRFSVRWALLPVLAGVLWTIAALRVTGGQLGVFNLPVLPLLLGLGLDDNVHLVDAMNRGESLPSAWARLAWPLGLATAATLCGFAGSLVSANPGVRSIGHLGLVGFATMLTSSLVFLPALVSFTRGRGVALEGDS
jgi:predicted RND superfamily exporter protein